jgi:hypothetical protein
MTTIVVAETFGEILSADRTSAILALAVPNDQPFLEVAQPGSARRTTATRRRTRVSSPASASKLVVREFLGRATAIRRRHP